jgi:hypothetical protein
MRSKSGIKWGSHQIERRTRTRRRKTKIRARIRTIKAGQIRNKNENIGTKQSVGKRWEVSQESDDEVIK